MKFFTLLLILLSGCAFEHKKEGAAGASASGRVQPLNRPVGYAEVMQAVIAPRCLSCHSAAGGNKGGINLEDFARTAPLAPLILNSVVEVRSMPPGQSLSSEELSLVASWVQQGASVNGSRDGRASAPLLYVQWPKVQEVFAKSCYDCHSAPNPDAGLDLTSLTEVRLNISKIFDSAIVVRGMPLDPYPPLSIEEREILAKWIVLGMPE